MKKLIMFLLFGIAAGHLQAQSKYEEAVLKGKRLFSELDTADGYLKVVNYFDRIAQKESGEWIPLYYQAQAYAIQGANEQNVEQKENLLSLGLEKVRAAQALSTHHEIVILEGFIQMIRISVDPATRGQTLSPVAIRLLQDGLAADPQNPRGLLFMGQMMLGMANFFGTPTTEACTMIQKAMVIFEQDKDEPSIFPDWGEGAAAWSSSMCEQ